MAAEISGRRLAQVAARTLEDAAFVFTEPADPPPPFGGPVLEARLTYEGPERGELRLVADAPVAGVLAANLLGLEPDDPRVEGQGRDALGEVLNILAGVWAAELFGAGATCRLGVPVVRERPAGDPPEGEGASVVSLVLDGGAGRLDVLARTLGAEG